MRLRLPSQILKNIFKTDNLEILPAVSIKYFLYLVISLVLVLVTIDRIIIPQLEDKKKLVGIGWYEDNIKININNSNKILNGPLPAVWESAGFHVSKDRIKKHRILVMGDSFVWGDGYSNMNYLWWRQLQRELERRGYHDVEIIAAGACGLSTKQELELAQKIVPVYKPNLLIWGYVTNDADEGLIPQSNIVQSSQFRSFGHALDKIMPNLNIVIQNAHLNMIRTKLSGEQHGYEYYKWEMKLIENANLESYKRTIASTAAFISKSNTPSFFMTLPTYPDRQHFTEHYGKIEPLFQEAGIPFFNNLEKYLERSAKISSLNTANKLMWGINPGNGHPGTFSTHFYALAAADILESKYAFALGKKTERKRPPLKVNDWVPYNLNPTFSLEGVFFNYPESNEHMLRMPIRRQHIRLNLENPARIQDIEIRGVDLKSVNIFITAENERLSYDDESIQELGEKTGSSVSWDLKQAPFADRVYSLLVSATFSGSNRGIEIKFNRESL